MVKPAFRYDVSIVVAIYNQQQYVASCADSILRQKFDGNLEVVIVDDCSSDNSPVALRDILSVDRRISCNLIQASHNEYAANKGFKDWARYYQMCTGRFVAFLDCDDYWTDREKLTKQSVYLERNQEASMCFHDYIMSSDISEIKELGRLPDRFKKKYIKQELLFGAYAYILFGTVMCRNVGFNFPPEMRIIENVDLMFPMYMGQFGECHYCDDIAPMIYRQNKSGIWSGASPARRARQKLRSAFLLGAYLLREEKFDVFLAQATRRIGPELNAFMSLLHQQRRKD